MVEPLAASLAASRAKLADFTRMGDAYEQMIAAGNSKDIVEPDLNFHRASVALGLQRTGGIITSAALLLIIVVGAFATSGIVFVKMIGVGLVIAIALDATIVRALLVPATMRLLGRWNWWLPGALTRRLPAMDAEAQ